MLKKKFIIIDANALIHRAFHALPPLTTKKGKLVNAVYGFTTIFLKVLKDLKPDYLACAFDVSKKTFRNKDYPAYKATRIKQPQELYDQIPIIKELLEAFKVKIYGLENYEADDLIGTLTRATRINADLDSHRGVDLGGLKNIIVTGDLDTLQLIDENTEVYTLKRGITENIIYDERAVKERYSLTPQQMIDFKALRGDPSDNIPGVKGIGEKTAIKLIKEFGSLEAIYEYLDQGKRPFDSTQGKQKASRGIKESILSKLLKYRKEAFLSKKLVTIVKNVPIKFNLEECMLKPFDMNRVIKLLQELEFHSLLSRIPKVESIAQGKQGALPLKSRVSSTPGLISSYKASKIDKSQTVSKSQFLKSKNYHLIDSEKKFKYFLSQLKKQKEFTLDTETTGINPFESDLMGISFSWKVGEAWYLPILNFNLQDKLKKILESGTIKKIGHNIKFDLEVLDKIGIELNGLNFDTMIASYLLNPGSRQHNLNLIVFTEFGHQMEPLENLIGEKRKDQIPLEKVPQDRMAQYSCEDADFTFRLKERLEKKLKEQNLTQVFEKIEMPLIPVLKDMEKNGIKIDGQFLKKLSKKAATRIKKIEARIFKFTKCKFNINSPQQLKEVLFEKLKISPEGLSRTKTGISTAAAELEKLKSKHPVIDLISQYRELSKLKSTYLDTLPKLVNPKTGRVHTSFNQTITATGRLSSSDPNLQNIPIRTELGREIRQAFIAEKNYKLITADYSQIDLRVVASLSADQKMLKAFYSNEDIHTRTAAEIFEVSPEKVTSGMRRQAKTINFGILYGLGPHGLADSAGISYEEAKKFIDKYFQIHKGIKEYIEQTKALARKLGYVETLFGRRRYLPEIVAEHEALRSQAERMAINHPVQGCLQFDTRVLTSGGYKKIGKLYENKKLRPKYIWNGSKWCKYEVLNRGKTELAQIEFENGQVLNCDIRHEILVVDDCGYRWIHYRNLKKDMKVCFSIPKIINFQEKQKFSFSYRGKVHNAKGLQINKLAPKLWYWVGYYYGDGYLSKRKDKNKYRYALSYSFGKKSEAKAQECVDYFNSLGLNSSIREFTRPSKSGRLSTRIKIIISSDGLGKLFEAIGIKAFVTAHTKRLPDLIFSESLENRKKFIEGLMDSNGCYGGGDYVPNIHLCQRGLLADIQILLRTMGVDSKLRGPYKYNNVVSFRLDIPRRALFKVLNKKGQDFIGTHYNHKYIPQFIIKELLTKYPNLTRKDLKTNSDYILYNCWKNGGNSSIYYFIEWLERNNLGLDSPIYIWHKVKKIKSLKKKEITYTLRVKGGSHRFDSEGVISKNTAADLVKIAMIKISLKLKALGLKQEAKMILQVHDELVFEIRDNLVKKVAPMIEKEMEEACKLKAPIKVRVSIGKNWGECK